MGLKFSITNSNFDEDSVVGFSPVETVKRITEGKANAILNSLRENDLVITADTIVVLDKKVIGKPANEKDAIQMLSKLSDKKHEVITAVCVQTVSKKIIFSSSTFVYFKKLSNDEIFYYVEHYKPLDKAGAYGIQEWMGTVAVEKIEGSYHNVMGLPTQDLYQHLQSF